MLRPCKLSKSGSSPSSRIKDLDTTIRMDHISQLPDEIIISIFNLLPIRDAVRASSLSPSWKHACSNMSSLNFNGLDMFGEICIGGEYIDKFVRGVNQFLRFHQGPEVISFEVSCCLGWDNTDDIDGWVSFAIRKGAERLSLELYCKSLDALKFDANGTKTEGKYVFRRELFGYTKNQLKHLCLAACCLGPNLADQFGCLQTLTLAYMPLQTYDLASMLPCLIKLQDCFLRSCNLPVKLWLCSLPLLERFRVFRCVGLKEIKLSDVPNLLVFEYCPANYVETLSIHFDGVSNLKRFRTAVDRRGLHYLFTRLPKYSVMLTALSVGVSIDWVKNIPQSITTFSNVTMLRLLFNRRQKFDILKMISILKAFPSLQKLCLYIHCPDDVEQGTPELSECVYNHLEHVKIGGFCSTSNEIEFAIYLLKHAIVLKEMVIMQENLFIRKRQVWDEVERQKIFQKICDRLPGFSRPVRLFFV